MAAPPVESVPFDSGYTLPGIQARGTSDHEVGTAPPSGFLQTQTYVDGNAHSKRFDDVTTSLGGSINHIHGSFYSDRMLSPTVPWGNCAPFASVDAATIAPAHHNTWTSYTSPTMALGLRYPFALETQAPVPTSSITAAQGFQKPWPSGMNPYLGPNQELWDAKAGRIRDASAKLQEGCSCHPEALNLALKMEGPLYKRRSVRWLHQIPAMEALIPNDCSRLPIPFAHLRAHPGNAVDRSRSSSQFVRSYLACLRVHVSAGWPEDTILGPTRVNADWLFLDNAPETVAPTRSQWIAQSISTFEVLGVPEKLGLMVLYSRYFKVCLDLLPATIFANVSSGW